MGDWQKDLKHGQAIEALAHSCGLYYFHFQGCCFLARSGMMSQNLWGPTCMGRSMAREGGRAGKRSVTHAWQVRVARWLGL